MADSSSPFSRLPAFAAAGGARDDEWAPWGSGSPGRGGSTPSPTWVAAAPHMSLAMGQRTESEPAPASPGAARGAKRARAAVQPSSRSGARRPARGEGMSQTRRGAPGGAATADAPLASYLRALAAASDPPTMLALRDALYRLSRNTDAAARAGGVGAVSPESLTARARATDRVVAAMLFAPTGVPAC